jgi:hypothetical protein
MADRFSDALLHTVLSSLRAPEAVRTCALSRRWRSLWRSTPRVNIDQRDFEKSRRRDDDDSDDDSSDDEEEEDKWARFENFTTDLLLFHDSSLGEFRPALLPCP